MKLTIELPAGSGITGAAVLKDGTEIAKPVPVKDRIVVAGEYPTGDYYFSVRLYKNAELYGVVSELVQVRADLESAKTHTLAWEDLKAFYRITYHFNLQKDTKTETDSYQVTAGKTLLTTPSQQGYVFEGWYDNPNFRGSRITAIPAGSRGDKDFYAWWWTQSKGRISGASLADALSVIQQCISTDADAAKAYTIMLKGDETVNEFALSYGGKTVSITLTTSGVERKLSLSSRSKMFVVTGGVTLTLENNVTLQGYSDNNSPLVELQGGTLVMKAGSKITGNKARRGGGVYDVGVYNAGDSSTFTKEGGIIYGSNADIGLKNAASGGGQAVYADASSGAAKMRNATAGTGVNMDSRISGDAGGWE
jgi:uncharacterized repeat protein (TIGR02543 family)